MNTKNHPHRRHLTVFESMEQLSSESSLIHVILFNILIGVPAIRELFWGQPENRKKSAIILSKNKLVVPFLLFVLSKVHILRSLLASIELLRFVPSTENARILLRMLHHDVIDVRVASYSVLTSDEYSGFIDQEGRQQIESFYSRHLSLLKGNVLVVESLWISGEIALCRPITCCEEFVNDLGLFQVDSTTGFLPQFSAKVRVEPGISFLDLKPDTQLLWKRDGMSESPIIGPPRNRFATLARHDPTFNLENYTLRFKPEMRIEITLSGLQILKNKPSNIGFIFVGFLPDIKVHRLDIVFNIDYQDYRQSPEYVFRKYRESWLQGRPILSPAGSDGTVQLDAAEAEQFTPRTGDVLVFNCIDSSPCHGIISLREKIGPDQFTALLYLTTYGGERIRVVNGELYRRLRWTEASNWPGTSPNEQQTVERTARLGSFTLLGDANVFDFGESRG